MLASGDHAEAAAVLETVANRASAAGLVAITERARALQAEAWWTLGRYEDAAAQFVGCVERLAPIGDVLSMTEVCVSRARAMSASVNPNDLLAPIQPFVESQPAYVTRLEWTLATARYLKSSGDDALPMYKRAAAILTKMLSRLDPTVQAALRVHPWSREIRAAGGSV